MEGKGETSYNSRVCSGVQGVILVGCWGTGRRRYITSDLGHKIYVLADDGTAEVEYRGLLYQNQQQLIHRVRLSDHQQAALLG